MFDRYTSDSLNPVFFKIVHQMTSSPIMPLLYVIQALLVFGFFLGATHLNSFKSDEMGHIFLGFYSFSAIIQIICFAYQQLIENKEDGLDPSWGTRLTSWQIIGGQYMALVLMIALSLLISTPVYLYLRHTTEMPPTIYFWAFLIMFSAGVIGLGVSASSDKKKSGSSRSVIPIVIVVFFLMPALSNLFTLAAFLTKGEVPYQILTLLILIPLLLLVMSYEYGAYLPITMERFGLFRKLLLATIPYSLLIIFFILKYVIKDSDITDMKHSLDAFRIVVLVYSLFYTATAGTEAMHPTYRRKLYARDNYSRQFLTIPWQSGAVPGFLTGLLLSFLVLVSMPKLDVEDFGHLAIIYGTLAFPLLGLVLLLRRHVGEKMQPTVLILIVGAMIVSVIIFSAGEVFSTLDSFAKSAPYLFILFNYALGILLGMPGILRYFQELRPKPPFP